MYKYNSPEIFGYQNELYEPFDCTKIMSLAMLQKILTWPMFVAQCGWHIIISNKSGKEVERVHVAWTVGPFVRWSEPVVRAT